MTTSVKFLLPYLSVGQSQKEVTHNEALAMIDILLTKACSSIETGPPATSDGLVVLVAASGTTGAFVGKENKIAYYLTATGAWAYLTPVTGQEIFVTSTTVNYRYTGSAWTPMNGIYTPTLTNVTNINSSTAYACQFMRVGNVVTVSGKVRFNCNTAAAAQIDLSLPVASNFTAEEQCAGTASSEDVADGPMYVKANPTDNRASIYSTTDGTSAHDHFYHFTYLVI
jgi:hypothetical protein